MNISGGYTLAKKDIERMRADAEKYAGEDRKRREEAEVRNRAETLTHTTEKSLSENADRVPHDITAEVSSAVANLKKALDGTDAAAIRAATEKVAQASQKMGTAIFAQTPGRVCAADRSAAGLAVRAGTGPRRHGCVAGDASMGTAAMPVTILRSWRAGGARRSARPGRRPPRTDWRARKSPWHRPRCRCRCGRRKRVPRRIRSSNISDTKE